jgi:hypothetical protein
MPSRVPPEGYRLEWVPDRDWRLASDVEFETRRCRRMQCLRHPVAALKRANGWWLYCSWHLYGRKIEDGVVLHQRMVLDE